MDEYHFECNYQYYQMQNSRRIEGEGIIHRSEEWQHINTTHLPYDRSIKAVSYYTRRKKQLKRHPSSEVIINLTDRNAQRSDLKDHIQSIFKSSKSIDPFISNYIKEIRVDPVISDNKFTNFNEELYSLSQDEKVKVLEQRYFPLQNYYNYIYDLERKKEISRFVNQNETKAVEAVKDYRISEKSLKSEESKLQKLRNSVFPQQQIQQRFSTKDKKIKGFYQSRFEPKIKNPKTQRPPSQRESALIQKYKQAITNDPIFRFSVSENQRMELSYKR